MVDEMDIKAYQNSKISHYEIFWNNKSIIKNWDKGPVESLLLQGFCILEFQPTLQRNMWTYATCGMSKIEDIDPIELHVFSLKQNNELVELLTIVAHYHNFGEKLNLNHTVNFGKPWQNKSICDYGLISLPYLDGTGLENCDLANETIKCYWLIPITKQELDYKKENGIEALEMLFDQSQLDFIDENRESLV